MVKGHFKSLSDENKGVFITSSFFENTHDFGFWSRATAAATPGYYLFINTMKSNNLTCKLAYIIRKMNLKWAHLSCIFDSNRHKLCEKLTWTIKRQDNGERHAALTILFAFLGRLCLLGEPRVQPRRRLSVVAVKRGGRDREGEWEGAWSMARERRVGTERERCWWIPNSATESFQRKDETPLSVWL